MHSRVKQLDFQLRVIETEILLNKDTLKATLKDMPYIKAVNYTNTKTSKTNNISNITEFEAIRRIETKSFFNSHIRRLEERKSKLERERRNLHDR